MPVVCRTSLPEEMIAAFRSDVFCNRSFRGGLKMRDSRFYYDEAAPELGVMHVSTAAGDPVVSFSYGDVVFLSGLIGELPQGIRHYFAMPDRLLVDRLQEQLICEPVDEMLIMAREASDTLPSEPARRLIASDLEAFERHRPGLGAVLERIAVFGVIEEGVCVADAWVIPDTDRSASVGNLLTHELHRRRGFGRAAASACVNHILETDRMPLYEVSAQNAASVSLARQLGFSVKTVEYEFYGQRRWPRS